MKSIFCVLGFTIFLLLQVVASERVYRAGRKSQVAVGKDSEDTSKAGLAKIEKSLKKKLKKCKKLFLKYRRKKCRRKAEKAAARKRRCEKYKLKPLYLAIEDGTFDKDFKALVGMTVEQSIQRYNELCPLLSESPCTPLAYDTIVDLFRGPESSNRIVLAEPNIHWIYRVDVLNSNTAKTVAEAEERCFKKMPIHESVFHGVRNSKYVDQSGHMESVFTPEGKVVVSIKEMGTFNFFGKANGKWAKGMREAHVEADVKPYLNILSRKCMKSKRLSIGLKIKEGINFLLPKKYKMKTQLDQGSTFTKKYGCGYGNYRKEFMKKWDELRSQPQIISKNMKRTFWRMFQFDRDAMKPGQLFDGVRGKVPKEMIARTARTYGRIRDRLGR